MLDQEPGRAGDGRKAGLKVEPIAHIARKRAPVFGLGKQRPHAIGEEGRKRHLPARIGRYFGLAARRRPCLQRHVADAMKGKELAREEERVAGRQPLREIFLDLAEHAPAAAGPGNRASL